MKLNKNLTVVLLSASLMSFTESGFAQEPIEEIVVTGIRASLASALEEKRTADNLIEVIQAVDIGKLPDQNLAEVLENVTGVQITRTAGVGTGVQIRGTNANRTEINGVSTVGSGSAIVGNGTGSRSMNFEDISAGIISAVEVTKAPDAKTIEGSVGGTINLKTIRPLDLNDTLGFIRIQGEDSSLSQDGITPRISGTWGDSWSTDAGEFGLVISASSTEQDVTSFRPRADRDNFVGSDSGAASAQSFDYLPIQFLIQDYDNYEYDTKNFAGSFEWAPSDTVKLYFDAIITEQESRQESSRVQASGISGLINTAAPSDFETVDFGTLDGENGSQDLGSIEAAVRGVIPLDADGSDGNLRFSSDTNSRLTDSEIFRLGVDWQANDRLSARLEFSTSSSDSNTPSFNTTLNFINPNSPLDAAALLANHQLNEINGNEDLYDSNENGTPFEYDLTGGSLTFGVAQDAAGGPTTAQLLDPANVVLRDVNFNKDKAENGEDALRIDLTYDLDSSIITTVDYGYRYTKTTSLRDQVRSSVGLREFADSPTGDLFESILVAGPDNFNAADGRELFVRDFLVIDPELAASNPDRVRDVLNDAIVANNAITGSTRGPISQPTSSQSAFFDIEEQTNALYAQANFESGIFRGNIGLRYLETDVNTFGFTVDSENITREDRRKSNYHFLLPRLNLVADITDDIIVRTGWGKDIRRPDFDDLSTSFSFSTSPNNSVVIGNPNLEPEEVTSFDLAAEWYFAPSSVFVVGIFHKTRDGLHVLNTDSPFEDPVTGYRDITGPDCEGGGIFNPIADINVFGPDPGVGVCVPTDQTINGAGETTQKGIEIAVQYDLADLEDELGWASGFGVIANWTKQEFSGGDTFLNATSRASTVFAANGNTDVTLRAQLIDLSETAYNLTTYYEKYGLSARVRYTWRDAYRSQDFGSTSSQPWGFPVVQEARGQLNASVNYNVNDHLNLGIEAVNLTESDVEQSCVNEGALLCFQGLTDRRITFGASYRF